MKRFAARIYQYVINPPTDEALARTREESELELPTLWLLGKTGAGKSTIVQKLTGASRAEIGNGFMPCTRDSRSYDFPQERPLLRFLDTRGLGEVDYDAREDIGRLGGSSHAVLVVMRVADAEQSALLGALKQVRRSARHIRASEILTVHTAPGELPHARDRERAIALKQQVLEEVWGSGLDYCVVDFGELPGGGLADTGGDELRALLAARLPELRLWLGERQHRDAEQRNFERLSAEVLWYAGTAATTDALPVVGLVTVPAIQGKMLHSLARRYGMAWNRRSFSEFTAALGAGAALRYAVSLGGRQFGKLVPAWGQLLGTAFAVAVSYGATWALGRAACKYLYHKQTGTPMDEAALRRVYTEALAAGRAAGRSAFGGEGK
jgi:uncharacterized protein (DUF697 family)